MNTNQGRGHTHMVRYAAIILLVGLLLPYLKSTPAHAATLNVPGDYATIQAALQAASNGDTITVAAGTYNESLVVTKSVIIEASGDVILDGKQGAGPGITVAANNVTIRGLTIRNFSGTTSKGAGIYLGANAANATIAGNTVQNTNWAGIMVWTDGSSIVQGLTIDDNTITMGTWSQNTNVYGIECTNCANSTIKNNNVTGGYVSIVLTAQGKAGQSVTVANNEISGNVLSGATLAPIQVASFDPERGSGTPAINTLTLTNNTITVANDATALFVYPVGSATISNVTADSNTFNDSASVATAATPRDAIPPTASQVCTPAQATAGCSVLAAVQTDANMVDIRNVATLDVKGNTMTTQSRSGAALFIANSNDIEVSNNTMTLQNARAQAIYLNASTNIEILRNTITANNPQSNTDSWRNHALDIYYVSGNVNIEGNTITVRGTLSSGTFYHGINLEGNQVVAIVINSNAIIMKESVASSQSYLAASASDSTGIRVRQPQSAQSTINIKYNSINGWGYGIWFDEMPTGMVITLYGNDLSGNRVALQASPNGALIEAGYNWWGTENPSSTVTGNATIYPILGAGTVDADDTMPGFQPDETSWKVIPADPSALAGSIFLPFVQGPGVGPSNIIQRDLIGQIILNPSKQNYIAGEAVEITLVITNQGDLEATSPFWVDMYFNPDPVPMTAGVSWYDVCGIKPCYGMVWEVPTIQPRTSIKLVSTNINKEYSSWYGWLASGTTDIYAYIDSWGGSREQAQGGVTEDNEANNLVHLGGLTVTGDTPFVPTTSLQMLPRPGHPRNSE